MLSKIHYGKFSLLLIIIIIATSIYLLINVFKPDPPPRTFATLDNYYLSSSQGNDNNPGTADQPFKTLSIIRQLPKTTGMSIHALCNDTWGNKDNLTKTAISLNWDGETPYDRAYFSAYYIANGNPVINKDCPPNQTKPTIYGSLVWHQYDDNNNVILESGIYGRAPTGFYAGMIDMQGTNFTVKNIIIRNASGAGVVDTIGGNIFDGVEIHRAAQASIKLSKISGSIIKNGHFTDISVAPLMKYLDDAGNPSPMAPGMLTLIGDVQNSIVINNIIGPGYAEGTVVGRNSKFNIITGNTYVCVRAYGGFYPGGSSMNIFERNKSVGCPPNWKTEYLRPSNMAANGEIWSGAGFGAIIEGNVESGNGSGYLNITRNNLFANEYALLDYGIAKQHRNMREASTISFDENTNEIKDSAGGLGVFIQRENQWIKVRDSEFNDGNYQIIVWGSNAIKVKESLNAETQGKRIKLGKLLTPHIYNNTIVGMNRYTNRWNSDVPELTIKNNVFVNIAENICEVSANDPISHNAHSIQPINTHCTHETDINGTINLKDRQAIINITVDNIPPASAWELTDDNASLFNAGIDLNQPLPSIMTDGFTDWQKEQLGYPLDLTYNATDYNGNLRDKNPTLGAFVHIGTPPIDPPPIDPPIEPPIEPPIDPPIEKPTTCNCSCGCSMIQKNEKKSLLF